MPFAADFVRRKILVFGKSQVIALACFLMVNNFAPVQGSSELYAGDVLFLHAVVVNAKRKQAVVGGIKMRVAAYQLIFRVIAMAVCPFEISSFTDRIDPIVVVFFIEDFQGVQGNNCLMVFGVRGYMI